MNENRDEGRTEWLECQCRTPMHALRFELVAWTSLAHKDDLILLSTSAALSPLQSWYKRLWCALLFVLWPRYQCQFDEWLLRDEDVARLEALLSRYKELHIKEIA